MYGCKPCPKCGSVYRIPGTVGMVEKGEYVQVCDDCGHTEPWDAWLHSYIRGEAAAPETGDDR